MRRTEKRQRRRNKRGQTENKETGGKASGGGIKTENEHKERKERIDRVEADLNEETKERCKYKRKREEQQETQAMPEFNKEMEDGGSNGADEITKPRFWKRA